MELQRWVHCARIKVVACSCVATALLCLSGLWKPAEVTRWTRANSEGQLSILPGRNPHRHTQAQSAEHDQATWTEEQHDLRR
eukprot:4201357-Alexandrium_andersonii.AAC.1